MRLLLELSIIVWSAVAVSQPIKDRRPPIPPHKPHPPQLQPTTGSAAKSNSPPQDQPGGNGQLGTAEHPAIVKVLPAEKTAEERTQEKQDREDKSSADWWMVRLTGALALVGILQLSAFIGQIIVFAVQAKRLRETIETTREIAGRQGRDMQSSIAEATRAATAMERVADGIATSVENTAQIGSDQRAFWQMQMRAYASVRFGAVILQDRDTNYRFEVRLILVNTGHTPAYDVYYNVKTDVLPAPLPDDFSFQIPEVPISSAGVVGPQQVFTISAAVDRMYSDEEIAEISMGATRRLYIFGTVSYTDAFGVNRHTNFSQRVEWLRGGGFIGFNTRRHNDAT